MYGFLITGMSMLQAPVGLADSDDELQVLQLLIRADMLQGIKRLLQAQLAGQLGLDIQGNDGQPVVLQGDQRPEGVLLEDGAQDEREMEGDGFPVILRAVPFDIPGILNLDQADPVGQLINQVEVRADQPLEPVVVLSTSPTSSSTHRFSENSFRSSMYRVRSSSCAMDKEAESSSRQSNSCGL